MQGNRHVPAWLRQSALCSYRMRCERLTRSTKSLKLNIFNGLCRPDKRSASGCFAFVISL
ncbi:Putative cytosolic protein [Escherichia coli O25b:H4]|uniref:Putative cytosolic protein n=1 Tax=Escherichia coli O25b:H4 TaxID=941280 RepID=A0A192CH26_ECO25|nr:Putative cytosolic protein [Escherichia coli O25b:H4]